MTTRTRFTSGDRVMLDAMPDDPSPVTPGTLGTVTRVSVHDLGDGPREHVDVRWDDGRNLSLIVPPDRAHVVRTLPSMTQAQHDALRNLCHRYHVAFDEADYSPQFDLPAGYFAGWVGGIRGHQGPNGPTIYVGVSPEGEVSS